MKLLDAGQDTFVLLDEDGEPMEWINMCWRKVHEPISFVMAVYTAGLHPSGELQPALSMSCLVTKFAHQSQGGPCC